MSGFESDLDFGLGDGSGNRETDGSDRPGVATPHRSQRINLGTPANYYFKYMNSGKKSQNNEILFSNQTEEADTGTVSIPGLTLDGATSKTETSFFSIAGSSTGSEGSDDLLNKSTLSDTTELTASNFVLVTTSKQNMIRKSRNVYAQADNKENTFDQNDNGLPNKSLPLNGADSLFVGNQKGRADCKDEDSSKVMDCFVEKDYPLNSLNCRRLRSRLRLAMAINHLQLNLRRVKRQP